jgi:hypothetical protein
MSATAPQNRPVYQQKPANTLLFKAIVQRKTTLRRKMFPIDISLFKVQTQRVGF